jgi:hypothetical protein
LCISERAGGSQRAGSIQWAAAGQHLEFTIAKKPMDKSAQIPLWFELLLNSIFSAEARYGTLVHELAHLYLRLNPSVIWFAPGSASTRHPTNTSLRMSEDVLLRLPSALIEL